MKKWRLLICCFFYLLAGAEEFNDQLWAPVSLASVNLKWNLLTQGYEPGLSVKRPEKLALYATAVSEPFQCNIIPLVKTLILAGETRMLLEAPVSFCIRLRQDEQSPVFSAYIQDALVVDYLLEVSAHTRVRLFADFIAFAINENPANNFPLMIVRNFSLY
ncbi:MAG: hypothetical protein ACRCU9_09135 [Iodobacter sp.]